MENKDRWDKISADEQAEIDAGLAEADKGETIPHKEFMKRFDRWRKPFCNAEDNE